MIYLMCLSVVSEDSNEYVGTTSYDFSVDDHNKQIKCEATTPGFENEKMESTGTISIEGEQKRKTVLSNDPASTFCFMECIQRH